MGQQWYTWGMPRKFELDADGDPIVPLDDDAENWMAQDRLEKLQARGWKGTVAEYVDTVERLGGADPLEQGITSAQ